MDGSGKDDGPARLALAPALDTAAAAPLLEALKALRGHPITLDGSGVERLGALCLQVLLAARNTWAADEAKFTLARPSAPLTRAFALMGAASHFATEPAP